MLNARFPPAILLSLVIASAWSKEVTQELATEGEDRVTVTYEAVRSRDALTITFKNFRFRLGAKHNGEYDRSKVVAVFFDRIGGFRTYDFTPVDGLRMEALTLPENVSYDSGDGDGFHILRYGQQADVSFQASGGDATCEDITIPIFLAEYKEAGFIKKKIWKGKNGYLLFAKCEDLRIPVSAATGERGVKDQTQSPTMTVDEEYYVEEELTEDFTPSDQAKAMLADMSRILSSTDADRLRASREVFEKLQYDNVEGRLRPQIAGAIDRIDNRIAELKAESEDEEQRRRDEVEQRAESQMKKVTRLLEKQKELPFSKELEKAIDELNNISCEAAEMGMTKVTGRISKTNEKCEEKKKEMEDGESEKRNIWLIIGVVILAVLAFIGNLVFQMIRIRKTSDLAMRAQMEAEQRARSAVRNKVNRVGGAIRQKGRDVMRADISGQVKNTNIDKGKRTKI